MTPNETVSAREPGAPTPDEAVALLADNAAECAPGTHLEALYDMALTLAREGLAAREARFVVTHVGVNRRSVVGPLTEAQARTFAAKSDGVIKLLTPPYTRLTAPPEGKGGTDNGD